MKAIKNILFTCCLYLTVLVLFTACSDWNVPEPVDIGTNNAEEQNPELWERYMQKLHAYKQSKHFLTYARFDNGMDKPVNEGGYLRSLPDSLDIVTLGNADNITDFDREDIPRLQEKSTRVLYLVDYAAKMAALNDITKLGAYLDKAVATATELNLDGFAFTGIPLYSGTEAEFAAHKERIRLIVSKLSAAAGSGKLLVLEGDPALVEAADVEKLNYVVINTADVGNVTEVKLMIAGMLAYSSLSKDKYLLSARIGSEIADENNVKKSSVSLMLDFVASMGPLGGLAIYSIGDDYYSAKMNYETTRAVIQQMNPSK